MQKNQKSLMVRSMRTCVTDWQIRADYIGPAARQGGSNKGIYGSAVFFSLLVDFGVIIVPNSNWHLTSKLAWKSQKTVKKRIFLDQTKPF